MTEARAHRFVPQCWLAGFTDTGKKDGKLYVTDLKRRKQWQCKPSGAGHRRDFNRIEDSSVSDPLVIEKLFSKIEDEIAPVFRSLFDQKRCPKDDYELGIIVEYIALQWIRVPAFRAFVNRTFHTHVVKDLLGTRERWKGTLEKIGIPLDHPHSDYSRMLEVMNSQEVTLTATPGFYIQQGAKSVEKICSSLMKRRWNWLVSPTGQFIGSDSPVALDGEPGRQIGFQNAEMILFPVNRYLTVFGTHELVEVPRATTKLVARHNTFTILFSDEQLYSHRPDFHWVDKADKCQNDWTLFSKSDFEPSANSARGPGDGVF